MEYKTLNKKTQSKINYVNLTPKKRVLLTFLLCFLSFYLNAQNVEVRTYGVSGLAANVFTNSGFTTLNGGPISSTIAPLAISSMPSTVAGYAGVDIVIYETQLTGISSSQGKALIDFARAGGIVIASVEFGHTAANDDINYNILMTELFGVGHGGITKSIHSSLGINPTVFTHPNNGTLLLNDATGSITSITTSSYSYFYGVPSENRISVGLTSTGCDATALDIIYPAFPGGAGQQVGGVNFDGIIIFSGEAAGILLDFGGQGFTRGLTYNQSFTKLFYDFLHNPTAMATRRGWSSISTNVNANCPAAVHCYAGSNAPKF